MGEGRKCELHFENLEIDSILNQNYFVGKLNLSFILIDFISGASV